MSPVRRNSKAEAVDDASKRIQWLSSGACYELTDHAEISRHASASPSDGDRPASAAATSTRTAANIAVGWTATGNSQGISNRTGPAAPTCMLLLPTRMLLLGGRCRTNTSVLT